MWGKACAALLFTVCLANSILLFYPLMMDGRVVAYENVVWVRVGEFALSVGLTLFGLMTVLKGAITCRKRRNAALDQ